MDLDSQKPFIWVKKYEEKGIKVDEKKIKEIEEENRRRAEENRLELLKIEERKRKRDLEYQQKLSDGEFLARQKEAEHYEHWEQQEDDFVLRQHKRRSKIRIRDGRAKTIDLLAHYIDIFGPKQEDDKKGSGYLQEERIQISDPVELTNPCEWLNGLRQSDLEALEPDIKIYMSADCEENQQYWKDLLEITRNEFSKLQAVKEQSEIKSSGSSDINTAVLPDVDSLIEGKTISELDEIEDEMSDILRDDDPSIDVSFYKSALSRLRAYRARIRLTLNHKKNLEEHKDKILEAPKEEPISVSKREEIISSDQSGVQEKTDKTKNTGTEKYQEGISANDDDEEEEDEEDNDDKYDQEAQQDANAPIDKYGKAREACVEDYLNGGYSPKMYRKSQLDPGIVCADYKKEYELLVHHRRQVSNASSLDEAKLVTMTSEERAFMDAASKGMNDQEESTFSCETAVRGHDNRALSYSWADKYQPRKPRYFNRVHTGFEWNKYNQTHYDIDNPPPKVVQGYKFNIFYPDLIDKSKAPTFTLTPCKDDKDFCVIRFSAGPPYEDIAFRIVNREWNNSYKSGYRCQFINNMLQLWFQFKRYRYRR